MRHCRLCFVVYSLRGGGTERVVATLANEMAERCDVILVTLSSQAPFYALDKKVRFFPSKSGYGVLRRFAHLRGLLHLRQVVGREGPDALCIFGESINAAALVALLFAPGKRILFDRASPLAVGSLRRRLVNPYVYRLAHKVVVQTERAKLLAEGRYKGTPVRVLSNPVTRLGGALPFDERGKIVINVGYVGGQKNQEFLIRCFLISKESRDWTLQLVGDGPDRERLEALVNDLQAADRVFFLGQVKDIGARLGAAQVFAFSSGSEGFPNALAEGLAAGCACISFDCVAGPSELITHERNGLLVAMGDEREYARQLSRLLGDDDLRRRLSEEASASVERYSIEKVLSRFEEIVFEA